MNIQMKPAVFNSSDKILIPSLLYSSMTACYYKGNREEKAQWLFQHFLKDSTKATLSSGIRR